MIPIWRPVNIGTYRVKRGDVLALFGTDPSEIESGDSENGFVIRGAAGTMLKDIWCDYGEEDEPTLWTKHNSDGNNVRLALNKLFSKPLPLP